MCAKCVYNRIKFVFLIKEQKISKVLKAQAQNQKAKFRKCSFLSNNQKAKKIYQICSSIVRDK